MNVNENELFIDGKDFIKIICDRLNKRHAYLTDSNIRIEIERLSYHEMKKIFLTNRETNNNNSNNGNS